MPMLQVERDIVSTSGFIFLPSSLLIARLEVCSHFMCLNFGFFVEHVLKYLPQIYVSLS